MLLIKKNFWLILILLLSTFLNFWHQDFPIEFHADEPKKVRFVLESTQDFMHPTLILQIARGVNWFVKLQDKQTVALIGRSISAISGTLTVFIFFLIGSRFLKKTFNYLFTLAIALSPILIIHAHYFKEDMLFLATTSLTLYALIIFFQFPTFKSKVFVGIALGLALSSKYIAFLLIPVILLAPFFFKKENIKSQIKSLFISIVIALTIFMVINYAILVDFTTFWSGLTYELSHVVEGHAFKIDHLQSNSQIKALISITPLDFWFSFHLIYSLIPGLTLPIFLLVIFGLSYTIVNYKKLSKEEGIFLFFITLFYFVTECSPTKPFPDFMRYMIPIVPLLLYFGIKGSQMACQKKVIALFLIPFIILSITYSFIDSTLLTYYLNADTRKDAHTWLALQEKNSIKGENYSLCSNRIASIAFLDINKERTQGVEHLVACNFFYDRILMATKLKKCPTKIVELNAQYGKLFAMPYIEFKPKWRSFAFSNPTIRIIHIKEPSSQTLCNSSIDSLNLPVDKEPDNFKPLIRESHTY